MTKKNKLFTSLLAAGLFLSFVVTPAIAAEPPVPVTDSENNMETDSNELPPLDLGTGYSPFKDANGSRYAEAVWFLHLNGIVNGLSETEFGVSQKIKRVDAAMMIGNYFVIDYLLEDVQKAPFTDLPPRAVSVVSAMYKAGIVKGKTAAQFDSAGLITRGEAVLMLSRIEGIEGTESMLPDGAAGGTAADYTKFTDYNPNSRYAEAIRIFAETGLIQGKSETRFGVDDSLTRGELALILYRILHPLEA